MACVLNASGCAINLQALRDNYLDGARWLAGCCFDYLDKSLSHGVLKKFITQSQALFSQTIF
jgi:hypothetical protein